MAAPARSSRQRWLALALVAGGVLAPVAADAADIRIELRAAAFVPVDVRGREGDTLTFVNQHAEAGDREVFAAVSEERRISMQNGAGPPPFVDHVRPKLAAA